MKTVSSFIFLLLFLPFCVFSQSLYIKPVFFFDYQISKIHSQLFLDFREDIVENYEFYALQDDTLISKDFPLILSNENINEWKIVVKNSDNQIIAYIPIVFDPQFLIADSFRVYQNFLLHNKNYEIKSGYKEIRIFKNAYQVSLPPYLFYKNKSKFIYTEKSCSLDFAKIRPNDLIGFYSMEDSIFIPVFKEYYPELKLADSLEAMIYLLTKSEYKFLKKVNKKSYLNFVWSGFDEENKMELKQLYFKRVYEANVYFHENIEGWRTERGMIYIIFGKPSAIVVYEGYEDWFYERTQLNDRPVYFRFKIQKQKGMKPEYILERKVEYYDIWNDAIDAWRNGLILKEK